MRYIESTEAVIHQRIRDGPINIILWSLWFITKMNHVLLLSLGLLMLVANISCQKCPAISDRDKKEFFKWTETKKVNGKLRPVTDAPCWFDLTRSDCGRCKKGGKQCGAPMEKYCQNPNNKFVS